MSKFKKVTFRGGLYWMETDEFVENIEKAFSFLGTGMQEVLSRVRILILQDAIFPDGDAPPTMPDGSDPVFAAVLDGTVWKDKKILGSAAEIGEGWES